MLIVGASKRTMVCLCVLSTGSDIVRCKLCCACSPAATENGRMKCSQWPLQTHAAAKYNWHFNRNELTASLTHFTQHRCDKLAILRASSSPSLAVLYVHLCVYWISRFHSRPVPGSSFRKAPNKNSSTHANTSECVERTCEWTFSAVQHTDAECAHDRQHKRTLISFDRGSKAYE